ncbi:MAG: rhodanese-like domain-containing protein [Acidibacillus sp.]|uniref:Sulfurtransferase n=1 Tax=Sulfoacidibacillus ferrooxidans TaxID=2005001 RepID=A0A9X1VCS8_9BACL|nr:rhodanese-like domain-containing protein [Sulfoacidibacillus ferrooxidans]MCI0183778.1 Sulfurtransferase [Sulfoacidibacillus ferrooxidans]MCY0892186.1 rhodanese-like domain-containing protein [Acidibacillus sp.]
MVRQWSSKDVLERLRNGRPLQIIDVREPFEYGHGHIPGARSVPLSQIGGRMHEIRRDVETVVVCQSGNRSRSACDFLARQGYTQIFNLQGGMSRWNGPTQ